MGAGDSNAHRDQIRRKEPKAFAATHNLPLTTKSTHKRWVVCTMSWAWPDSNKQGQCPTPVAHVQVNPVVGSGDGREGR